MEQLNKINLNNIIFDTLDININNVYLCNINNCEFIGNIKYNIKNSNINFDNLKWINNNFDAHNLSISIETGTNILEFLNKLNNKNIRVEYKAANFITDSEKLSNKFEGVLVNHTHSQLIYNIARLKLLNPQNPPTLETNKNNQIQESFYNKTLNNSLLTVLMSLPIGRYLQYSF